MSVERLNPSFKSIVALGLLRMPLALLELPLFVLLPKLYNELFGLSLATVGVVLLATRFFDAILDPFLGVWIDRSHAAFTTKTASTKTSFNYRFWIAAFLPLLIISFGALLFAPSAWKGSDYIAIWLGVFSVFTYIAYSVISISYQAWGAQWGNSNVQRAKVTTTREACGLVGVLLAAIWLSPDKRIALFSTMCVLSALALMAMFRLPAPTKPLPDMSPRFSPLAEFRRLLLDTKFRWLIGVFALNGIATAIPATLVLFFINDVVGANDKAPMFLASYFLAGAVGMPVWAWLAKRIGLKNTWLVGMLFAVLAFAGALGIQKGDDHFFLGICIVTGLALGADLAMPPALLATLIANNSDPTTGESKEATYFGLWSLVTKLNLAIAAGLGLPLLQWLGYQPNAIGLASNAGMQNVLALSLVYAALPCALKLIAGTALLLAPLKEDPET
jgi:glycoside/pentoside/hexuronide:cation symporter, GPH family